MRKIPVIVVVLVLAGGATAQPIVPGYSIETYAQLNGPQMLTIDDASCTLYVGNIAQSGAIYRIPEAGIVEAYGPALNDPDAVICAQGLFSQVSDRVLVGGRGPAYIKAILPDQSVECIFPPASGVPAVVFSNPTDMAFDSGDRLVFTDIDHGAVYASNSPDPADNPSRLCTPGGRPVNIVVDSSDNIYVSMQYWGTVRKYDAAGTLLDPEFGSGLLDDTSASSVPIAIAGRGPWGKDLYAIGNRKLIRIDMDTGDMEDIGSGFDSAAYGDMAFGPDGALYISDIVGDAILRITRDAPQRRLGPPWTGDCDIGTSGIGYDVGAPVPEPGTLTLLVLGAAALIRRRRK